MPGTTQLKKLEPPEKEKLSDNQIADLHDQIRALRKENRQYWDLLVSDEAQIRYLKAILYEVSRIDDETLRTATTRADSKLEVFHRILKVL